MRCSGKSLVKSIPITDLLTVPSAGVLWSLRDWGEYQCEKCGFLEYDDYGKARNYVEKHMGANAAEVAKATGVPQKSIRDMLKEGKLEIAKDSVIFLKCEICGAKISSGKYCPKCEMNYHHDLEEMARKARHHGDTFGYSTERRKGEDGAKRFTRE